jgi:hypothetical protein
MGTPTRSNLAPLPKFRKRLWKGIFIAVSMISGSMLLGMVGYHFICGLGWIDSILNASMILTGMGPVDPMKNDAAKLFASAYALFSGVAFLTTIAVVLAPIIHRTMHKFHIDDTEN